MMACRGVGAAVLALWAVIATQAAAQQAPQFVPHRAVYSISLGSNLPGSQVVSARGEYEVEFNQACDGWAWEIRSTIRLFSRDAVRAVTEIEVAGFEAADGRSLRFARRHEVNGELREEGRGIATVDGRQGARGGPGAARVIAVPPGTLFPVQLNWALVQQAAAGTPSATRQYFGGSAPEGVQSVRIDVSGSASDPPPEGSSIDDQLLGGRSWLFRMTYFRPGQGERQRDFELVGRIFETAVMTDPMLVFPDFTLRLRLDLLDAVPRPQC